MKLFRAKFFVSIIAVFLLLGFGYYYRDDIGRLTQKIISQSQPCQKPITYSIENLDPRFGLTKTELLDYIKQAEKIWESPINQQLFEYSPTGDLKINFIYDYRQKATDALKNIGIVINDDQATYNALKTKYDLLIASYNKDQAQIEILTATYNSDKRDYEQEVKYWNKRGGASKTEYDLLEQKRIDLNNQVTTINQAEISLNELIDTINSAAAVLNKLINTLKLQVSTYNTIGSSTGETFNEGEYVSGANGTTINIFQFNNRVQLVEVLAHELGHALAIEHLSNPEAIMYYLNEGINEKLTTDDLVALKKVCGIK